MISSWLTNFLGTLGTAALLLVVGISYLIWQFNPTINLPQRNLAQETDEMEEPEGQELQAPAIKASAATTIHDLYTEAAGGAAEKGKRNGYDQKPDRDIFKIPPNGKYFAIHQQVDAYHKKERTEKQGGDPKSPVNKKIRKISAQAAEQIGHFCFVVR